jgi:hypothetical protein
MTCDKKRCKLCCSDNCCYKYTACCWSWKARLLWFSISVCLLTLGSVISYISYKNTLTDNQNLNETVCTVVYHNITIMGDASTIYQCPCFMDCSSGTVCGQNCLTCLKYEHMGWIGVSYLSVVQPIIVVQSYGSQPDVPTYLVQTYPIGGSISCYYSIINPNTVQLFKNSAFGYLVFFIICITVGCLIIIVWSVLDMVRCIKKLQQRKANKTLLSSPTTSA